ncbi:hypothetical protein SAMN05421741_10739 [Paenimyroides ummariense]|uniref:CopG family transcriptional regulator / antitoxin EndoAI n=1 Tax=Paenimyroides ummariense TaxID=913024 RepID=A0A1I4ZZJ0_9FLAO|nr:hypothetical protein [Paenimyroides ummariense]SFN55568.1 hypothetical protein SAMN05421741_10739 [Paenimyroides ummariense]
MSTIELKKELHNYIENADDQFLRMFYEMAKAYMLQKNKDKMIAEGEKDIKNGQTYTLEEAKEIMKKWNP